MCGPIVIAQSRIATSALAEGDERLGVAGGGALLSEGDDGEEAEDAHRDDRALEQPGREVADRQALVHSSHDREEGDPAADEPEDIHELEDEAERDLLVGAGARDVGRFVDRRPDEDRGRDRTDEGDEVEDAADEGGLTERGHFGTLLSRIAGGITGR